MSDAIKLANFEKASDYVTKGLVPLELFVVGCKIAAVNGFNLKKDDLRDYQVDAVTEYGKKCDSADYPVARIAWEGAQRSKHDFSYFVLETRENGNVNVSFGSSRTDGDAGHLKPGEDIADYLKFLKKRALDWGMLPESEFPSITETPKVWSPVIPARDKGIAPRPQI